MRKQVLLFAGMSLFLCAGLNAQTQKSADDPIWEMGFDGSVAMFDDTDPASLGDSIKWLEYYGWLTSSQETAQNHDGWALDTISTVKFDTIIEVRHGIAPVYEEEEGARKDYYRIEGITDEDKAELVNLGVDPDYQNLYYLKYFASPSTKSYSTNYWNPDPAGVVNDYQANLFARGIKVEPYTSYRLTLYMRVDDENAWLDARLLRGWYDSEKPFAMDASGNNQFVGVQKAVDWKDPITGEMPKNMLGKWKRYTFMYYYKDSALLNELCQNQFYWAADGERWGTEFEKLKYRLTPEQAKMFTKKVQKITEYEDEDGIIQNDTTIIDSVYAHKIAQPSNFFLRLAFRGPQTTYDVDQISLYKSSIGAAEWNAGSTVIRVNFGYQTNIADLCKVTPIGRLALMDEEGVVIPGVFDLTVQNAAGEEIDDIEIDHIEYQSDGMIYIWLTDVPENDYKMWLSFTNPEDIKYQLKYNSNLYPYFEDEDWVAAGKIVKNFEKEQVLRSSFADVPTIYDVPPTLVKAEPVEKSFNLGESHKEFKLYLSRPAYINALDEAYTMTVYLEAKRDGEAEPIHLTLGEMDLSDTSVVATLPRKPADGIYNLVLGNMRAVEDDVPSEYVDEPTEVEFTWGKDYIDDNTTTEGVYYQKLQKSFVADTTYIGTYSSMKEKPQVLVDFIDLVSKYVPEEFINSHFAPADYDAAAKTLDDALAQVKKDMAIFDQFVALMEKAKAEIEDEATIALYGDTKRFKDLKDTYEEYSKTDFSKASSAEVTAAYNNLFGLCNAVYAIPALTAQARDLYRLVKVDLGAEFSDATKDILTEEAISKLEDDDRYIVSLLKLEAVRAIYSTLNANKPINNADASGFITNPELYMTGVLDTEIERYTAGWHNSVDAWRVKQNTDWNTVFPGWTLKTEQTGGWFDYYGVWAADCEEEWNPSMGAYNVAEGQVLAGMLGCDWDSKFTIKQNIADLPAGQYTIVMGNKNDPGHPETNPNDQIIANNDTLSNQAVDSTTITTTLEEAGDLYVEFTHNKVNRSVYMKSAMLYLTAEKDPSFDYGAAITEIDKAIGDVKTNITTSNYNNAVEFYNLNGVRVDALRPGEIGIRIENGVAEKVLF